MYRCALLMCLPAALGCGVEFSGSGPQGAGGEGGVEDGDGGEATMASSVTTTVGSGGAGATTGAGGQGGDGGFGGAGSTCIPVTGLAPTVADCVVTGNPNPDSCDGLAGYANVMHVDGESSGSQLLGFMRFELPGDFDATDVESITVTVVVGGASVAASTAGGELWQVTPFTRAELFGSYPQYVGSTPLGADAGVVSPGQVVSWTFSADAVDDGSLFVGIRPTVTNGTQYDNLAGATPPVLDVTCAP